LHPKVLSSCDIYFSRYEIHWPDGLLFLEGGETYSQPPTFLALPEDCSLVSVEGPKQVRFLKESNLREPSTEANGLKFAAFGFGQDGAMYFFHD